MWFTQQTEQGPPEKETGTGLDQPERIPAGLLAGPMTLSNAINSSHSEPQFSHLCKGPNCMDLPESLGVRMK